MKYLLALLLLAGSVWGDCERYDMSRSSLGKLAHKTATGDFDGGLAEANPIFQHTYLDTVEVCDTVWYYNTEYLGNQLVFRDSIPKITTRKAVISKQKKQVWLTEKEYDKLMELLNPSEFWIISGDTIGVKRR